MQGPCVFTLLVPSTPHGLGWAADMHGGGEEAERHRAGFLQELRDEGLNVSDAKVGDPDPLAAIQDECNFNEYDELIVSTLPLHVSKWLKVDLPRKARPRPAARSRTWWGAPPDGPRGDAGVDPVIERTCAECGTKLTDAEIQASLEPAGPSSAASTRRGVRSTRTGA
jgi:hypothetical protein